MNPSFIKCRMKFVGFFLNTFKQSTDVRIQTRFYSAMSKYESHLTHVGKSFHFFRCFRFQKKRIESSNYNFYPILLSLEMLVLKLSNKELMVERLETSRGLLKRKELYDHTYIRCPVWVPEPSYSSNHPRTSKFRKVAKLIHVVMYLLNMYTKLISLFLSHSRSNW